MYIVILIRPDSNFSNYNRVTKFDKATNNESFRVTSIMAGYSLKYLARFLEYLTLMHHHVL